MKQGLGANAENHLEAESWVELAVDLNGANVKVISLSLSVPCFQVVKQHLALTMTPLYRKSEFISSSLLQKF